MKKILLFIGCMAGLLLAVSCGGGDQRRVSNGKPYSLVGTLWQDSVLVDSFVTLMVDRHESFFSAMGDTVPAFEEIVLPVVQGHFSYEGQAPIDADELFVYDQHGHLARLYATSGASLTLEVTQSGDVWVSKPDSSELLEALMLRDSIPFWDSLAVRRALGKLSDAAKPAWLMERIDLELAQKTGHLGRNFRLPRVSLALADTAYDLLDSRQESLVLLFWAAFDSASIDSLKVFQQVARDYGLYTDARTFKNEKSATRSRKAHHIELMSVCLYAPDSASWKSAVKGIPGKHTLLNAGFAHPLVSACEVRSLPFLMVTDRFGNYQTHNQWGSELYRFLERTPLNSEMNKELLKR
ncbi:MAG: hypothetical protein J6U31_01675 [Bacteroidales bacterium]|nr:hypothetical protein [Bacteroidales bacterium]